MDYKSFLCGHSGLYSRVDSSEMVKEVGDDMKKMLAELGLELRRAASRTKASIHWAPVLTTTPREKSFILTVENQDYI